MPRGRKTPSKNGGATFRTPQKGANEGEEEDADMANELADMEARIIERQEEEGRRRDAQMEQIMAAIAALQPTDQPTPPPPQPAAPTGTPATAPPAQPANSRRRINVSSLERMEPEITLRDFATWKSKWTDFCRLERLDEHSAEEQVSALGMNMSTAMLQIVEMALGIDANVPTTPDAILNAIQRHIRSKRSVELDRVEFNECRQMPNEIFDTFYIRLRQIAEGANFCLTCQDDRLKTAIISGIHNTETRRKLLAINPPPNLQGTIDLCRSEESAADNESSLSRQRVARISEKGNSKAKRGKSKSKTTKSDDQCSRCGYPAHQGDQHCPAKDKSCNRCSKKGHLESMCKTKATATDPDPSKSGKKPGGRVGGIRIRKIESSRRAPTVQLTVSTFKRPKSVAKITAVPDSGAEATLTGIDVLQALKINRKSLDTSGSDELEAANRTTIQSIGRINAELELCGRRTNTVIIFTDEQEGMLLSWYASRDLGILPEDYPNICSPIPINSDIHTNRT